MDARPKTPREIIQDKRPDGTHAIRIDNMVESDDDSPAREVTPDPAPRLDKPGQDPSLVLEPELESPTKNRQQKLL